MSRGDGLDPLGTHGVDGLVERVGRRLASRTTRRSFLDRLAKVAMLVAAGPTLGSILTARRAEARVCGQSGVAPACPTFDCVGDDDVWGWCWYASAGCCSNGGLKKICDCCRLDFPFVHGYCPSGYNVYCIVESCAADPRVMTVPIDRLPGVTIPTMAAAVSRSRFSPRRGGTAVIADLEDLLTAAIARPLAASLDAPLLLTARAQLSSATIAEVQRLGATVAVVVGGAISAAVLDEIASYGLVVRRAGTALDVGPLSVEIARELIDRTGVRRAWCVAPFGESAAAAPAASAVAAAKLGPLVVGVDAAVALSNTGAGTVVTHLVGPGAAERAGEVAGGFAVFGANRDELAVALANLAVGPERLGGLTLHLVPSGWAGLAAAAGPGLVLWHPDGSLGITPYDWALRNRAAVARATLVGSFGGFGDDGVYHLQSALNGFDTFALQGVEGQGLPVIDQPLSERPLGLARVAGATPPPNPAYWSSRANPGR